MRRILMTVAWLVLSSCQPRPASGPAPSDAVREYVAAVEDGDADAVYDLLDPDIRGSLDRDGFRSYFEANQAELAEHARSLAALAARGKPEIVAEVRVDETVVPLRRDGGEWKVAAPVIPAPPARHPADVLRRLRRLLEGSGGRALRRLGSPDARTRFDAFVAALPEAAEGLAEPDGDTMMLVVPVGDGAVRLIRTPEGWGMDALRWGADEP